MCAVDQILLEVRQALTEKITSPRLMLLCGKVGVLCGLCDWQRQIINRGREWEKKTKLMTAREIAQVQAREKKRRQVPCGSSCVEKNKEIGAASRKKSHASPCPEKKKTRAYWAIEKIVHHAMLRLLCEEAEKVKSGVEVYCIKQNSTHTLGGKCSR
jgi:hypothetical protein